MNALSGTHGQKAAIQVLTLSLHGETYAVEARHVREILDAVPVTDVPGAPRELNGLINVRGKVVPLLDLCLKLGLAPSPPSIDTRFIVVEAPVAGMPTVVGVRADRVFEMAELAGEALEDTPQIGMRVPHSFVRCIGKRAGEFVVVLNLESILRTERGATDFVNRRRHKRLKVSMPCRIEIDGQSTPARIADLSEGGAAIAGFPFAPLEASGQLAIDGVAEGVTFRKVDFNDGTLRLKFEPAGIPAISALVRRLEKEAADAG